MLLTDSSMAFDICFVIILFCFYKVTDFEMDNILDLLKQYLRFFSDRLIQNHFDEGLQVQMNN